MKKSFMLFNDTLNVLDRLSNEQAGILFKAIANYNKGIELPELDFALEMAFLPFENQFRRDINKYNSICERNRNNGIKGGRPKKEENPNNPTGFLETQQNPKNHDKDTDKDNETDNDNDKIEDSAPPKKTKPKLKRDRLTIQQSEIFYKSEIEKLNGQLQTPEGEMYKTVIDFLFGRFETETTSKMVHEKVLSMPLQLNFKDFLKIKKEAEKKKEKILKIIQKMETGINSQNQSYARHDSLYHSMLKFLDDK